FFHQTDEIMGQIWQFLNLNTIAPPPHIRYNIGTYPPVKQEIKQQLKGFFTTYNQKLSDYLQQKFSWQE
ncbi:MAG: sulfotransferase, partial [Cyanobacteria bacterium P01_A01_bin.83]